MKASKIQALEALLERALNSVVIRSKSADSMGVPEYKDNLLRVRAVYDPDLRGRISIFHPDIEQPEVKESVLNFLKTELTEYIHNDRILSADVVAWDLLANGAPVDAILKSLLRKAIVDGEMIAAQSFGERINGKLAVYSHFFALSGVQVGSEEEVFPGVFLIPLPNYPDQFPPYIPSDTFSIFSKSLFTISSGLAP